MAKIKFEFKKGGKVKMEVEGIPGQGCQKVTAAYAARMLGQTTSDTPTQEMYEAEKEVEQEHEQQ